MKSTCYIKWPAWIPWILRGNSNSNNQTINMAIRTRMTLSKINTKINTKLGKVISKSNGLNINMKLKNYINISSQQLPVRSFQDCTGPWSDDGPMLQFAEYGKCMHEMYQENEKKMGWKMALHVWDLVEFCHTLQTGQCLDDLRCPYGQKCFF